MKEIRKINNIESAMYIRALDAKVAYLKLVESKCIKLRKVITLYYLKKISGDKLLTKMSIIMHSKFNNLDEAFSHYKVLKCSLRISADMCKYLKSQFNKSQRLFSYKN